MFSLVGRAAGAGAQRSPAPTQLQYNGLLLIRSGGVSSSEQSCNALVLQIAQSASQAASCAVLGRRGPGAALPLLTGCPVCSVTLSSHALAAQLQTYNNLPNPQLKYVFKFVFSTIFPGYCGCTSVNWTGLCTRTARCRGRAARAVRISSFSCRVRCNRIRRQCKQNTVLLLVNIRSGLLSYPAPSRYYLCRAG